MRREIIDRAPQRLLMGGAVCYRCKERKAEVRLLCELCYVKDRYQIHKEFGPPTRDRSYPEWVYASHAAERIREEQKFPDFVDVKALLNYAIREALSEDLQKIISLRFGLDGVPAMSYVDAGHALKLTRERIRQKESKAIRLLREFMFSRRFSVFADLAHLFFAFQSRTYDPYPYFPEEIPR